MNDLKSSNIFNNCNKENIMEKLEIEGFQVKDLHIYSDEVILEILNYDNFEEEKIKFNFPGFEVISHSSDIKDMEYCNVEQVHGIMETASSDKIKITYELLLPSGKTYYFSIEGKSENIPSIERIIENKEKKYENSDIRYESNCITDVMETLDIKSELIDYVDLVKDKYGNTEIVMIEFESGSTLKFYHEQDCCESVYLESVDTNIDNLQGSKLLGIEEVAQKGNEDDYGSKTWTFYKIKTTSGYFTFRWLGKSNGHYSETVSIEYNKVDLIKYCDGKVIKL